MKKRKRPTRNKKFAMRRDQIQSLRGLLMAKMGRNITMSEFADILGISHRQLSYLQRGERNPGPRSFKGVMSLREHGIMVHMSDFEVKQKPGDVGHTHT